MAALKPTLAIRLDDANTDRVRRNHDERITELQGLPASAMKVIPGVKLDDGVETPILHGLGRPCIWHKESTVRGPTAPGVIEEVRSGSYDRAKYVVLKASGYGATVTVDLAVM